MADRRGHSDRDRVRPRDYGADPRDRSDRKDRESSSSMVDYRRDDRSRQPDRRDDRKRERSPVRDDDRRRRRREEDERPAQTSYGGRDGPDEDRAYDEYLKDERDKRGDERRPERGDRDRDRMDRTSTTDRRDQDLARKSRDFDRDRDVRQPRESYPRGTAATTGREDTRYDRPRGDREDRDVREPYENPSWPVDGERKERYGGGVEADRPAAYEPKSSPSSAWGEIREPSMPRNRDEREGSDRDRERQREKERGGFDRGDKTSSRGRTPPRDGEREAHQGDKDRLRKEDRGEGSHPEARGWPRGRWEEEKERGGGGGGRDRMRFGMPPRGMMDPYAMLPPPFDMHGFPSMPMPMPGAPFGMVMPPEWAWHGDFGPPRGWMPGRDVPPYGIDPRAFPPGAWPGAEFEERRESYSRSPEREMKKEKEDTSRVSESAEKEVHASPMDTDKESVVQPLTEQTETDFEDRPVHSSLFAIEHIVSGVEPDPELAGDVMMQWIAKLKAKAHTNYHRTIAARTKAIAADDDEAEEGMISPEEERKNDKEMYSHVYSCPPDMLRNLEQGAKAGTVLQMDFSPADQFSRLGFRHHS
eukprot:GILK01010887.1.p1 GENE.GILK01010887.1~~GILK01010887.1.p1  ORF type:complete len:602 (+),score=73.70 GILK01010887.1:46-1806(+)